MEAGDVGGEQGQADRGPAEAVGGEEVAVCLAFAAFFQAGIAADADDAEQVDDDDGKIDAADFIEHAALTGISFLPTRSPDRRSPDRRWLRPASMFEGRMP